MEYFFAMDVLKDCYRYKNDSIKLFVELPLLNVIKNSRPKLITLIGLHCEVNKVILQKQNFSENQEDKRIMTNILEVIILSGLNKYDSARSY